MDKEIDPKKCEYLSELPVLALAVHNEYNFNNERKWIRIAHQTAGLGTYQHYMIGTILTPKPKTLNAMREIEKYWLGSNRGWLDGDDCNSLDDIIKYRKQLKRLLGVDCNICYNEFEEGIYPIDCSLKNIRKICKDGVPNNFTTFINWKNTLRAKLEKVCVEDRWHLYILGENSD